MIQITSHVSFVDGGKNAMVKKYIHKPQPKNGKWIIRIVDSLSPLANTLEEHEFNTFGDAYRAYPKIKKEVGEYF